MLDADELSSNDYTVNISGTVGGIVVLESVNEFKMDKRACNRASNTTFNASCTYLTPSKKLRNINSNDILLSLYSCNRRPLNKVPYVIYPTLISSSSSAKVCTLVSCGTRPLSFYSVAVQQKRHPSRSTRRAVRSDL